jgi:hypothetical protein
MAQQPQIQPLMVEVKTYFFLDCIDVYMFTSVVNGIDDVDGSCGGYGSYKDKWNYPLCYLYEALYRQLDLRFYTVRVSHLKP